MIRPFLPVCKLLFLAIYCLSVNAVTRESDLLLRWSFDEGSGSNSQNLIGTGLDVILHPGVTWGNEANGTAKSRYSLDLSSGTSRASVIHDARLQASNDFSILFWFKSNGTPEDFAQLLSKRQGTFSSYFVQIDPNGGSLKTLFRKYGTYYDTGSIPFTPNDWHLLAASHDGEKISSYLDGKLIYETIQNDPIFVEEGSLGIGGTADGGSLFNGWIDDLRIYGKALSPEDIQNAWSDGDGDFGPAPDFSSLDRSPSSMPMTINFVFRDSSGLESPVSGFDLSDITVDGATISNFIQISDSNYSFDLDSTDRPNRIRLRIPAASAKDDLNITTSAAETVIVYGDIVTRSEDLVGWWTFDEHELLQVSGSTFDPNWTPQDLSNPPVLWLDANDSSTITSTGNALTEWRDKLNPSVSLQPTNTSQRPTTGSILNGLGAIDFDVGNRIQSSGNPLGGNGASVSDSALYIVYKLQSSGLRQSIFNNGANWRSHGPWTNGYVYWDVGSGSGSRIQAASWATTGETLIGLWYSSATEGIQQVWKNGKLYVGDETAQTTSISGEFRLGESQLNALVGEVILINGVLSENDRKQIDEYLMVKWDLSDRRISRDFSGGSSYAKLVGGASIDQTEDSFGSGALRLNGSDAWAQIPIERQLPEKSEIVRFDDLEIWWPLDGNLSDMSGNNRDASVVGQEQWESGYFGQAFTFSGDDHLFVSGYKGISGTNPRSISLWIKTLNTSWKSIAYWGSQTAGQRWWVRSYKNEFRVDIHSATRRTFTHQLNNGVWHHLVAILPAGKRNRSDILLYVDGKEGESYGQWGQQNTLDTGEDFDFRIGGRWDNWDKFIGAMDDVRLYSSVLRDFDIKKIYGAGKSDLEDLGEKSFTVSVWAKPEKLVPEMEYAFATAWYEASGVEEMQAVFDQDRIDESEFNKLTTINPKASKQLSIFPEGLTFRAFNGSFGNTQLDDIDGKGFPLGNQIENNSITRTADANFSILTAFPTSEPSEDSLLWEQGGTGTGAFVGFRDGHFRIRAGDGGANPGAPASSTNTMALLDLNFTTLQSLGVTDGKLHHVQWEMRIGSQGSVPGGFDYGLITRW